MTRFFKFVLATFVTISLMSCAQAAPVPEPLKDTKLVAASAAKDQTITLAGGCFWGIQAVYQHMKGVKSAISGYAGGEASTAHYDQVSTGSTGHAEAVQVTYDPSQVTLGQILKVYFFTAHNPTELNYQTPDHGTQYRSEIFTQDAEQTEIAKAYIAQLDAAKAFSAPIVTKIEPLKAFYPAEAYHQDFARRNPLHPYIMINDLPKVADLKSRFPSLYKD